MISCVMRASTASISVRLPAIAFGLPLLPDGASWFSSRLQSEKRVHQLAGLNCSPILVTGTKAEFLDWIGAGLKAGDIAVPEPIAT